MASEEAYKRWRNKRRSTCRKTVKTLVLNSLLPYNFNAPSPHVKQQCAVGALTLCFYVPNVMVTL